AAHRGVRSKTGVIHETNSRDASGQTRAQGRVRARTTASTSAPSTGGRAADHGLDAHQVAKLLGKRCVGRWRMDPYRVGRWRFQVNDLTVSGYSQIDI